MRACIGAPIADVPCPGQMVPTTISRGAWRFTTRGAITHSSATALGPHSPYLVSDATFERIRTCADELDATVMIHLHESVAEIEQSVSVHGVRPIERLGRSRSPFAASHRRALHPSRCHGYRACSPGWHAGGSLSGIEPQAPATEVAPVDAMLAAGLTVALGTDGAASNNSLDLVGEMRLAALLAKGNSRDSTVLDAATALRMATLNGARALGLDSDTGSLVPGKWADLCCMNLDAPATLPVYSPLSQIVYAASRDQVSDTWVAGKHLVSDGQFTLLDAERLRHHATRWSERIAALAARAA